MRHRRGTHPVACMLLATVVAGCAGGERPGSPTDSTAAVGADTVRSAGGDTSATSPAAAGPALPSGNAPGVPGSTGARWGGPAFVGRGGDVAWSPRTMLDSATADVDGDGTAERVELWAAIERDRRGRPMFDDGQRWALVVRDGDAVYPLFDGFIQLGRLDFWVVESFDQGPTAILAHQRTPNGVLLQRYVFDRGRGGFTSTGAVDAIGNVVHQPPAP